jgi:hypothetical protein
LVVDRAFAELTYIHANNINTNSHISDKRQPRPSTICPAPNGVARLIAPSATPDMKCAPPIIILGCHKFLAGQRGKGWVGGSENHLSDDESSFSLNRKLDRETGASHHARAKNDTGQAQSIQRGSNLENDDGNCDMKDTDDSTETPN